MCVCVCVCVCACVSVYLCTHVTHVCECEFFPITFKIRLRCHCTYVHILYTVVIFLLFQFFHHSMSMTTVNESTRIDSEEIVDDVDMYHSLDGFDYCVVPYEIPEVVPEESTSDDEMEISRTLSTSSMDVDEDIAEDEAKRGRCVLTCEEGKLEPHVRLSLYEDRLWRLQVSGVNVVYISNMYCIQSLYLEYVLYTVSISPVCTAYSVCISSMYCIQCLYLQYVLYTVSISPLCTVYSVYISSMYYIRVVCPVV